MSTWSCPRAETGSSSPRSCETYPWTSFRAVAGGRSPPSSSITPALEPDDAALIELAKRMLEPADTGDERDSESDRLRDGPIPAGYTYLGQFIDHDITFDPVSDLQRLNDPEALRDFRTPRLDLDSL